MLAPVHVTVFVKLEGVKSFAATVPVTPTRFTSIVVFCAIFLPVILKVDVPPSFTDVAVCNVKFVYVGVVSTLLSTMVTLTSSAPLSRDSVNVSSPSPSVTSSLVSTVKLAALLLTVKLPVREAPSMSALDTPVIVYATPTPSCTSVVVRLTVKLLPSFTDDALALTVYVGSRLVSLIVTVMLSSPLSSARLNVSKFSVVASAVTLNVTVSVVPVTKLPVRLAPFISALETPVIV